MLSYTLRGLKLLERAWPILEDTLITTWLALSICMRSWQSTTARRCVCWFFDWYCYVSHKFLKQMVFSSSSTVYGQPEKIPCVEDFELKAMNPYGRTKVCFTELSTSFTVSSRGIENWFDLLCWVAFPGRNRKRHTESRTRMENHFAEILQSRWSSWERQNRWRS